VPRVLRPYISAVREVVRGAEEYQERPIMRANLQMPQAPGARRSNAKANTLIAYTLASTFFRTNLSDRKPVAIRPTTLRPLIRPNAVAAVEMDSPLPSAKGMKCINIIAVMKPQRIAI
jgi:hypothetical protein